MRRSQTPSSNGRGLTKGEMRSLNKALWSALPDKNEFEQTRCCVLQDVAAYLAGPRPGPRGLTYHSTKARRLVQHLRQRRGLQRLLGQWTGHSRRPSVTSK